VGSNDLAETTAAATVVDHSLETVPARVIPASAARHPSTSRQF
jgi:hypothetical protein